MTDTLTLPTAPLAVPIVDPKEERLARIHEAFRVLAGAGDALGIANFLQDFGIRGNKASSDSCPVALYIFEATGVRVSVGQRRWWALDPLNSGSAAPGIVPDCVREFMYHFDHGAFPELQSSRGSTEERTGFSARTVRLELDLNRWADTRRKLRNEQR